MTIPTLLHRAALVAPGSRRGIRAKVKDWVGMVLVLLKVYSGPWAAARHGKPSPDAALSRERARVDTFFTGMWPR